MFTTACCRLLALKGYPLLVVTPGNQPPEILRAVRELGPLHEQVVLLGYPPFVKDVIDGGIADGMRWDQYSVHLVLAGEMFSEAWRDIVRERAGMQTLINGSASLYGTADAGVLGNETPLSISIRRFANEHPEVSEALFGTRRPPTLVQYDPIDRYFEHAGDALVFSGEGGGIPLVRYAIGDTGGVVPWQVMLERLAELGFQRDETLPVRELPFVYLFGRSMHAVSFYGANVFAEGVRVGLEDAAVRAQLSGKFVMQVVEDDNADLSLTLDVELGRGVEPSAELEAKVAACVQGELSRASSEFQNYVPRARQTPSVRLWPHAHPQHFPVGVKHRYVRQF
jgi:phenylacetate-CoA ligase